MSRMTSKGQVTIPKRIRAYLGLKPGAEVAFEPNGDGQVIIRAARRDKVLASETKNRPGRFDALVGSAGPGLSTDEVMRLTRGWGEPDYDVK